MSLQSKGAPKEYYTVYKMSLVDLISAKFYLDSILYAISNSSIGIRCRTTVPDNSY